MSWNDVLAPGVVIVTGKGGTGKSTVAAALAIAAADRGLSVLLAEVEGRAEVVRTLGVQAPGFAERGTPWGFNALSITPHETVREYLRRHAGVRRIPGSLLRAGVVDTVVAATPGVRDLLALGMIYEVLEARQRRRRRGEAQYELVIVDGPPTGQIAGFLAAPLTFSALARVGRIQRQAASIQEMLQGRGRVLVVAVPEEMSVVETSESVPAIKEAGVREVVVLINRTAPAVSPASSAGASHLSPERAVSLGSSAGVALSQGDAATVLGLGDASAHRVRADRSITAPLERFGPPLSLPDVSGLDVERPAEPLARVVNGEDLDMIPPDLPSPAKDLGPEAASLGPAVEGARLLVICGSGGSGKTTASAAVAIHAAGRGLRTVLLTVDPARRLATALGLPSVGDERTNVRLGSGVAMDAEQLDTRRTFDELIERFTDDPAQRERILTNPVYEKMADTLGGTHEYMAMEKLHQLAEQTDYEAIVIDTPPTRSALAFLDAPARLTDFLGGRFLRWALWPSVQTGKATMSAARIGANLFVRTLERALGVRVLGQVVEFLSAFRGMYAGFKARAAEVPELMGSPDCVFVVVSSPTPTSLEEAAFFVERLSRGGMRAAAVVLNRVHPHVLTLPAGSGAAARALTQGTEEERVLGFALAESLRAQWRAAREGASIRDFAARVPGVPIVVVPELQGDVHDVAGLRRVAGHLFGED